MNSPKCPVCARAAGSTQHSDRVVRTIDCPACGTFDSPFTTEIALLEGLNARDRAVLRHWLGHQPRGDQPLVLTHDLARTVLSSHKLPLPDEQEESLIRAIGEALLLAPENQYIVVDLGLCATEIGAPNDDAVYSTILDLIRQNILEGPINIRHVQIKLTSAGWKRYKAITRSQAATAAPAAAVPLPGPSIVINADKFTGIVAAGAVSGQTSIVSTQTKTSAAPASDAPSPEIRDKWVRLEYPQKLGIIERLTAEGYQLKWESANNEAVSIDIDGWEFVVLEQPDGSRVRLKIHDHPAIGGYLVLLKRKLK